VVLIVAGSCAIRSEKALAARAAAPQLRAATADEMESSCAVSEFD